MQSLLIWGSVVSISNVGILRGLQDGKWKKIILLRPEYNLTPKLSIDRLGIHRNSLYLHFRTELFTELSLSMFTVWGNSLSGKIHLGQETDEIIFTFQLRGNLTAPFSQLTLRWGTWRELMTILPKLSPQSSNFQINLHWTLTGSLFLTWQYEGQCSVHLYSTLGDHWPPLIRWASSLVSEIITSRSEIQGAGVEMMGN